MPVLIPPGSGGAVTGLLKYEWVDPQGIVRDLSQRTSPNLFVAKGTSGLGAPPVDIVADKLPWTAGSLARYIQTKPVEIDLPIYASASSMGGLIDKMDDLRAWFDTGDESGFHPGYLRVTRPNDDAVRQIRCLYTGGLEGTLADGGPNDVALVVSLLATDPYWTDIAPTTATYTQDNLGISQGVVNTGDVDAYPIWTLHGPFTNLTLSNTTTNKALTLNPLTIPDGDTLTIDTRPSSQRSTLPIVNQNGASFYGRLTAQSALWWLRPGANSFLITASGASVATSFQLSWLPRYRGVLR